MTRNNSSRDRGIPVDTIAELAQEIDKSDSSHKSLTKVFLIIGVLLVSVSIVVVMSYLFNSKNILIASPNSMTFFLSFFEIAESFEFIEY